MQCRAVIDFFNRLHSRAFLKSASATGGVLPLVCAVVSLLLAPSTHAASIRWTDPAFKYIFSVSRQSVAPAPMFAVAGGGALGAGDTRNISSSQTLVFSVDGSATVALPNGGTTTVAGYTDPVTGYGITDARIHVTGADISDVYLAIYFFDELGNSYHDNEVIYATLGSDNSGWNLQAAVPDTYMTDGYSFELQLGYYNYEEDTFSLMATSTAPITYSNGQYFYTGSSPAPPGLSWTPDYTDVTIPEPVTGALALLGVAALFRRRRPQGASRTT